MDWYSQNVTGRVQNVINQLYAAGIDPLRSAEGRQLISRTINGMDVARIARNRQSALAANEFIKNRGILEAKGLYNADFDNAINGTRLEDWDSSNVVWNRVSPTEYRTIKELTEDWYNSRTPYNLTKEQVESFGMKYDPNYNYTGFTYEDLMDVAAQNTPGWQNSVYANYYRDQAKQQLIAEGNTNPSNQQVEQRLQRNVAEANMEFLVKPTRDADEFAIMQKRHSYDVALENLKEQHRRDAKNIGAPNAGSYNFADRLYQDSVGNVFGVSYAQFDPNTMGQNIYRTQYDYIQSLGNIQSVNSNGVVTGQINNTGLQSILNRFSLPNAITFNQFLRNSEGNKVRNDNAVWMTEQDINHLVSDQGLATYTAGYRGNIVNSNRYRDELNNIGYTHLQMKPTGRVYGAQMRDGRFKTYAQVIIQRSDGQPITEVDRGTFRGNNTVDTRTMWLDLGITSNAVANYTTDAQDLTPDFRSEHYRQTRSRAANELWHQKATDDDTDIVPMIAWPQN